MKLTKSKYDQVRNNRAYRARSAYIQERGGRCELCGEAYPPEIFDFHHPDPNRKETNLATRHWRGIAQRDRTQAEAASCHLLCSNCHRMEHVALKRGRSLIALKEKLNE